MKNKEIDLRGEKYESDLDFEDEDGVEEDDCDEEEVDKLLKSGIIDLDEESATDEEDYELNPWDVIDLEYYIQRILNWNESGTEDLIDLMDEKQFTEEEMKIFLLLLDKITD